MLFSSKLRAAAVAAGTAEHLRNRQPSAGWELDVSLASVSIGNRIIVTFEQTREGVAATIREPGQPGDDDPPITLRAAYDVTNLAFHLEAKAGLLNVVSIHAMRRNAVYEVKRGFLDYHKTAFSAGTRLTYLGQDFVPYHGGYTLRFAEAFVYLHEDDDVCRCLHDYLALEG